MSSERLKGSEKATIGGSFLAAIGVLMKSEVLATVGIFTAIAGVGAAAIRGVTSSSPK